MPHCISRSNRRSPWSRYLRSELPPQPRLAIPAWMAPLMRFALPSAPHARESISRTTENRDRSRVFLALDLSAFSVSHALDGFLLAKHRRFVSPDRHSWDFSPSELFPHVQPWRLSGARCPHVVVADAKATATAFRALIRTRVRWIHSVFSPIDIPDALLGLSPLQGFHPSCRGTAFAEPPLQDRSS